MSVTLFSRHTRQCDKLEDKLRRSGLDYTVCDDEMLLARNAVKQAPMLLVYVDQGAHALPYAQALKWIAKQKTDQ